MNKKQELAVITAAAAELGEDSYLGPWLTQVADELERDLRSDIVPSISLRDAARQAESIVAAAKQQAAYILAAAQKESEAQLAKVQQARAEAAAALYRVSRDAERLANSVSTAVR
jgi:cell division septum initiation protein DivIVA